MQNRIFQHYEKIFSLVVKCLKKAINLLTVKDFIIETRLFHFL